MKEQVSLLSSASSASNNKKKKRSLELSKSSSPLVAAAGTSASKEKEEENHHHDVTGFTKNHKQRTLLSKKAKQEAAELEEEQRLTAAIFGTSSSSGIGNIGSTFNDDEWDNEQQTIETISNKKKRNSNKKKHTKKNLLNDQGDEGDDSMGFFEIDRVGEGGMNDLEQDNDDKNDAEEESDTGKQSSRSRQSNSLNNNINNNNDSDDESDDDDNDKYYNTNATSSSTCAWIDEDDDKLHINLLDQNNIRLRKLRTSRYEVNATSVPANDVQQRLRQRYINTTQLTANTDWANLNNDESEQVVNEDEEDDDPLMKDFHSSSAPLLASSGYYHSSGYYNNNTKKLLPGILDVIRCPDANLADPNQAAVQAINFHPGSDPNRPLLLTAGLDKTLRFFQVSIDNSEKIHGIHFPKLPIHSASFLGSTGKVVVSGRRPFFYFYDAASAKLEFVPRILGRNEKSLEYCIPSPDGSILAFGGNDGYIILVDTHTKSHMYNLKINGSVRAITFTPDGNEIIASGSDGDIYRFDIGTRKCIERFSNQDGTITSYVAYSPTSRHFAVGAESGVVNLYSDNYYQQQQQQKQQSRCTTIKSIMNLKTSIDVMKYNGDGQILAIGSRRERESLRLVHVPSSTVFSNWPTSKTPLKYVWSIDFSPGSKFIAIGNDKGNCRLYRFKHYD